MLHLSTETFNNEQFSKLFLGRISAETCLKFDYSSSTSQIFTKRWGLALRTPIRLND